MPGQAVGETVAVAVGRVGSGVRVTVGDGVGDGVRVGRGVGEGPQSTATSIVLPADEQELNDRPAPIARICSLSL